MRRQTTRVLAIAPTTQGFAFAVFEGEDFLVDWGLLHTSRDLAGAKERFDTLALRFLPDMLALEDHANTRRGRRARKIIRALERRASRKNIRVTLVSRDEVKADFAKTGFSKHSIAEEIVRRFPELRGRLPKKRRAWESEKERLSIFDAASFALTALSKEASR